MVLCLQTRRYERAINSQCPMSPISPSEDGLSWGFHGNAWNYDKTELSTLEKLR